MSFFNFLKLKPTEVKMDKIFLAGGVIVKNVLKAYFKRIWVVSNDNFVN